jgi:hypothetical protein
VNLLPRLNDYVDAVAGFAQDPPVPFTHKVSE